MSIADIAVYSLSVYLTFHLASRADLLARPRAWALKVLPAKLSYPLSCALCWSFWTGVVLSLAAWMVTGTLTISAAVLFATPVINMVLDLVVRALIRVNEPPMVCVSTERSASPSTWGGYVSPGISDIIDSAPFLTFGTFGTHKPIAPSYVGKKAIVRFTGHEGRITQHYWDNDDCSGHFRKEVYVIEGHGKIAADECDVLDLPAE